jgi:hypothetical protein
MSKYGGTVLKTSLFKDDEKELQDALHGGGHPHDSPHQPVHPREPIPAEDQTRRRTGYSDGKTR